VRQDATFCNPTAVLKVKGGLKGTLTFFAVGLVMPPGDALAFANAVCRLASDPALRERMGAAGYVYAQTHLDKEGSGLQPCLLHRLARQRIRANSASLTSWVSGSAAMPALIRASSSGVFKSIFRPSRSVKCVCTFAAFLAGSNSISFAKMVLTIIVFVNT